MRVLILNWKDTKHPHAGGAEYATHQFAKHLVSLGHHVTLLTSRPSGLPIFDMVDGVTIVKRGTVWSMFFWIWLTYLLYFRHHTDIVIDQIHGFPFFTSLFVQVPILAWIHEVAGDIWKKEFGPVGYLGKIFEKTSLKLYKKIPFLTDSNSTKNELEQLGISTSLIHIVPLTIDVPKLLTVSKTPKPTLIFIGRLTPMKRIELLLCATQIMQKQIPQLKIRIVGKAKSEYKQKLIALIKKLEITKQVEFFEPVSETEKYKLLASSWLNIQPSMKEGFGLTVLEAASQKTPTIAFDVPGLRDVIKENTNGMLVHEDSPEALAQTIKELMQNKKRLHQLSQKAFDWSKALPTWETQTRKLERLLNDIS